MKRITKEEWLARAEAKFGSKFDYSQVEYKDQQKEVSIICPIHGLFWQRPQQHIASIHGCNLCSPTCGAAITKQQFIDKSISKHGDKFDYSKVVFTGVKKQVIIICPMHGEFLQIAEKHFYYGCSACARNKRSTTEKFIEEAKLIHGDKYDYSKVEYKSRHRSVWIICPSHGGWSQSPGNHLTGRGCKYCSIGNASKKEQNWLDKMGLPNDSKHRNVRLILEDGSYYIVDGCIPNSNVVYEFNGDFWHGNPAVFDLEKMNEKSHRTFGELFEKTIMKIRALRKAGYKVITIWESKYDKDTNNSRKPRKSTEDSRISW
jgi:hypothetical protein